MSKPNKKCLCQLVVDGAKLLAELAIAPGTPNAEQVDRIMQHVAKARKHVNPHHVERELRAAA